MEGEGVSHKHVAGNVSIADTVLGRLQQTDAIVGPSLGVMGQTHDEYVLVNTSHVSEGVM